MDIYFVQKDELSIEKTSLRTLFQSHYRFYTGLLKGVKCPVRTSVWSLNEGDITEFTIKNDQETWHVFYDVKLEQPFFYANQIMT